MKLFKEEPKIKFLNKKWYAFALSGLIIAGGVVMFFTRGFNKGIDFTGGTMVEVAFSADTTVAQLRARLASVGMGGAQIQRVGGDDRDHERRPQADESELPAEQRDREQHGSSSELGRREREGCDERAAAAATPQIARCRHDVARARRQGDAEERATRCGEEAASAG